MLPQLLVLSLIASPLAAAADARPGGEERLLGAYLFHRHGDRSAKAWKPVNLTALGAQQVHRSGAFYHARYLASGNGSDARFRIAGLSPDAAVPRQLDVTAPRDPVLHSSALAFLQGLYPPAAGAAETLANGTRVVAPLGGYQFVPVEPVGDTDRPEDNAWLQGGSGCTNAEISSNGYLSSAEYRRDYDGSLAFYRSLLPVINGTYGDKDATFKNGYSIFDLINVASIHNASIPSSSLLTPEVRARLYNLASAHEWNLAYNASEPVRAIAGQVLAGQILDSLQALVDAKPGTPRFHAQFGAYGTFMAFFGLAQLPAVSSDFYGICEYASSMAFELVTSVPANTKPKPEDISVRFLFANGTASEDTLKSYPLFGQSRATISWNDFKNGMSKFAIADTEHWCNTCGKKDGKCASSNTSASSDDGSSRAKVSGNSGISKPVAGVIGALVTLVVILGIQAAVMFLGGLRLVKKSTLAGVYRSSLGTEAGTVKA